MMTPVNSFLAMVCKYRGNGGKKCSDIGDPCMFVCHSLGSKVKHSFHSAIAYHDKATSNLTVTLSLFFSVCTGNFCFVVRKKVQQQSYTEHGHFVTTVDDP